MLDTKDRYCGECGERHDLFTDCGPDPDGTYPCRYGHFGCARTLHGRCRAEDRERGADSRAVAGEGAR